MIIYKGTFSPYRFCFLWHGGVTKKPVDILRVEVIRALKPEKWTCLGYLNPTYNQPKWRGTSSKENFQLNEKS